MQTPIDTAVIFIFMNEKNKLLHKYIPMIVAKYWFRALNAVAGRLFVISTVILMCALKFQIFTENYKYNKQCRSFDFIK